MTIIWGKKYSYSRNYTSTCIIISDEKGRRDSVYAKLSVKKTNWCLEFFFQPFYDYEYTKARATRIDYLPTDAITNNNPHTKFSTHIRQIFYSRNLSKIYLHRCNPPIIHRYTYRSRPILWNNHKKILKFFHPKYRNAGSSVWQKKVNSFLLRKIPVSRSSRWTRLHFSRQNVEYWLYLQYTFWNARGRWHFKIYNILIITKYYQFTHISSDLEISPNVQ